MISRCREMHFISAEFDSMEYVKLLRKPTELLSAPLQWGFRNSAAAVSPLIVSNPSTNWPKWLAEFCNEPEDFWDVLEKELEDVVREVWNERLDCTPSSLCETKISLFLFGLAIIPTLLSSSGDGFGPLTWWIDCLRLEFAQETGVFPRKAPDLRVFLMALWRWNRSPLLVWFR